MYKEVDGDLLKFAREGQFAFIAHGCNCFCTMGSGIAKSIREQFPAAYLADLRTAKGDIKKLGNYSEGKIIETTETKAFVVLNCYTQFRYDAKSKPFDYEAFIMCMRKINYEFSYHKIGLPLIGAGLGGGNWTIINGIIQKELKDMDITVVNYKP